MARNSAYLRAPMPSLPKLAAQFAFALLLVPAADASVVINILANRLDDQFGNAVVAGTLIQLVNLGSNGIFDEISTFDGTGTGIDRWVSGDDKVLDIPFTTTVGGEDLLGDFGSTAAIDLTHSKLNESSIGRFNRTFIFEFGADGLPEGIKLGIRWFPGLQAEDYYSGGGLTLQSGQRYGQFTRQSNLRVINSEFWISPGDGASITFDSLVTADSGSPPNPDPAVLGDALHIVDFPEPASAVLALAGAIGLTFIRRRRT